MNLNWPGIFSVIGALVAFGFTYSKLRGSAKTTRARFALLACLLAIPGASFAIYYVHVLPEPAWYYEFRSWPGTELSVVFLGMAGGAIATWIPRPLLVLPLGLSLAFAAAPFLKPILGPINETALQDRWDGDVCRQSTQSTCGPASAATILRHLGKEAGEKELARAAYSYIGGTEAWYLAREVRSRGCNVAFRFEEGYDADIPLPAIAGVRFGEFGHFIPILSRNGEVFSIGDPIRGAESVTRNVLLSRYKFTGFYMPISNPD